MNKNSKFIFGTIFLLGIFIGYSLKTSCPACAPCKNSNSSLLSSKEATRESSLVKVTRVIDGDTIVIDTGENVRYIGIDAPELHHPKKAVQCFGKEAMATNKELVEGKIVRLEKDISNKDKYGRLLRYVYLQKEDLNSSEDVFVNKHLVDEGYAYAATFPPDVAYADILQQAQENARISNKGLWSKCN